MVTNIKLFVVVLFFIIFQYFQFSVLQEAKMLSDTINKQEVSQATTLEDVNNTVPATLLSKLAALLLDYIQEHNGDVPKTLQEVMVYEPKAEIIKKLKKDFFTEELINRVPQLITYTYQIKPNKILSFSLCSPAFSDIPPLTSYEMANWSIKKRTESYPPYELCLNVNDINTTK